MNSILSKKNHEKSSVVHFFLKFFAVRFNRRQLVVMSVGASFSLLWYVVLVKVSEETVC